MRKLCANMEDKKHRVLSSSSVFGDERIPNNKVTSYAF